MESLRKFLKNNKNLEIFLTTENNTYEGKGKDILKKITKDEFDERVYSSSKDLMSGMLEVFSYVYDEF